VVKAVKPTVLIGTSTHTRAFSEEIVREMAKHVERPIIFPMSNPTSLCEVAPEDALAWTDGRALVATGSPFSPVALPGGKEYVVAQTNNALIYPALGLGAILARSRTISPSMIMAGVNSLASLSPALNNPEASLLPDLADVREVSVDVTAGVVRQAVEEGNATDEQTIKVVQGKAGISLEDYIRVSGSAGPGASCWLTGSHGCGTRCTARSSSSTRKAALLSSRIWKGAFGSHPHYRLSSCILLVFLPHSPRLFRSGRTRTGSADMACGAARGSHEQTRQPVRPGLETDSWAFHRAAKV